MTIINKKNNIDIIIKNLSKVKNIKKLAQFKKIVKVEINKTFKTNILTAKTRLTFIKKKYEYIKIINQTILLIEFLVKIY